MHTDTSPEAARVQLEALDRLGPSKCFEMAWHLSMTIIEMARQRLREEHPDWNEAQVRSELMWELHGIRIPTH